MIARLWWCALLIPAFWRQRQAVFCEFETRLVYRVRIRTGSKAKEKPFLKKNKKLNKKKKNQTYKKKEKENILSGIV